MASHAVAFMLGLVAAIVVAVGLVVLGVRWWRRWTTRAALRVHRRFGARIDRFKLTKRGDIVASLLSDPAIAATVRAHAAEHGVSEDTAWRLVRTYLDEIVPQFNLVLYYQLGLTIAEPLLKLFFRVRIIDKREAALAALPPNSVVVYLMNHRSNADYVLAGYALAGEVAISYAVGEWARVFPLEYLFKSFGAYFIRRRFREPLYHTVLERYVRLITKNGVTQGIFPEGGLSRDGKFRPTKIGLLDYMLGAAAETEAKGRAFIVPVGIGYDRVLEDVSLLRELHPERGHRPPPLLWQVGVVTWNLIWNLFRIITRSWKRHGDAVVVVGEPYSIDFWLDDVVQRRGSLFALSREERLGEVQKLADDAMRRVGEHVPVTAVPLVCAAIQSLEADYIPRARLTERVEEMLQSLRDDGRVIAADDEPVADRIERAMELLRSRLGIARSAEGLVVLPRGRELVSYYANTISHLLGEFAAAVKARDSLPVYAVVDL
jgi:glycerol-3-phosphate O-acyltransferase